MRLFAEPSAVKVMVIRHWPVNVERSVSWTSSVRLKCCQVAEAVVQVPCPPQRITRSFFGCCTPFSRMHTFHPYTRFRGMCMQPSSLSRILLRWDWYKTKHTFLCCHAYYDAMQFHKFESLQANSFYTSKQNTHRCIHDRKVRKSSIMITNICIWTPSANDSEIHSLARFG